jgi:hypothetical protein
MDTLPFIAEEEYDNDEQPDYTRDLTTPPHPPTDSPRPELELIPADAWTDHDDAVFDKACRDLDLTTDTNFEPKPLTTDEKDPMTFYQTRYDRILQYTAATNRPHILTSTDDVSDDDWDNYGDSIDPTPSTPPTPPPPPTPTVPPSNAPGPSVPASPPPSPPGNPAIAKIKQKLLTFFQKF